MPPGPLIKTWSAKSLTSGPSRSAAAVRRGSRAAWSRKNGIALGRAVDFAQVIDVALLGRVGIELDVRLREGQCARGDLFDVGAKRAHVFCGEGVAQDGVPVLLVLGDLFGAKRGHGLLQI